MEQLTFEDLREGRQCHKNNLQVKIVFYAVEFVLEHHGVLCELRSVPNRMTYVFVYYLVKGLLNNIGRSVGTAKSTPSWLCS